MSAPATLACELTFELLPRPTSGAAAACGAGASGSADSGMPPVPVRVRLGYDPADPFAVRAAFHTGADVWVQWVFARELLAAGFTGPTGLGDVQLHPDPTAGPRTGIVPGDRVAWIVLELRSPSGWAVFRADAARLGEFLLATYRLVGEGTEVEQVDLDAELAALLGEAQR